MSTSSDDIINCDILKKKKKKIVTVYHLCGCCFV